MRIIASLVCVSALIAPAFGKWWGWTIRQNKGGMFSKAREDAEWTCYYGSTKSKGPFTFEQAEEFMQEKLQKTYYNEDNVKIQNKWLTIPYSVLRDIHRDTETFYELETKAPEGKEARYLMSNLLRGALANPGEAIKDQRVRTRDYEGNKGEYMNVSTIVGKLVKARYGTSSAASLGGAGARLQILLENGCQKIQVSVQDCPNQKSLNRYVLNEARKRFGKKVITKDAATAKYFFRGGDSINKFDTNRPCWTEACHEDSWKPQGLYWPGEYALQHFHNIGISEARADVAVYEFDQKRFKKEGGEIIEMDEKMLKTNIISNDDINQVSGGDGAIETLLAEPEKMGSRIRNYMNSIRFQNYKHDYWMNRPIIIKRFNSQWDENHTGKVDCHIFVNGAAKYLTKKLQVELTK